MANQVGNALEEMNMATAPIVNLLRLMTMGPNPGDFRLNERIFRPLGPQMNNARMEETKTQHQSPPK